MPLFRTVFVVKPNNLNQTVEYKLSIVNFYLWVLGLIIHKVNAGDEGWGTLHQKFGKGIQHEKWTIRFCKNKGTKKIKEQ